MNKTEELIAKLKEFIKYLLKYIGNYESSSIRIKKLKSEIATLEQELATDEIHETCDGCKMFIDNLCQLDVSICPDCFEHSMWTRDDGEMDIQDFKDKYGLVYDDIETAIRNYVNGKQELAEQKLNKCFICGGELINNVCSKCTKELCSPINFNEQKPKSAEEIKQYLYDNAWRYDFLYHHQKEIKGWEKDHWIIRLLEQFASQKLDVREELIKCIDGDKMKLAEFKAQFNPAYMEFLKGKIDAFKKILDYLKQ